MKAIRTHKRGGPEELVYEDAPVPVVRQGDALVRVHATGITPAELSWSATYEDADGTPRIPAIPGHEVSGVIAALAPGVTGMLVGDAVYGLTDFNRDGAAAEYVAVRADDLAPKPRKLDHTQAAAAPLSALTAWQALFEIGGLAAGQRVLIHGAAGGVGTFAVQLARWKGAYVVATVSARHAAFVRELGADEAIDYATGRFEDNVREVDVVLDPIGGDTRERSWATLRRGGVLVTLPDPPPAARAEQAAVRGVFFIVQPNRAQLTEIARLLDEGAVRPVIAALLPLSAAREAFERGLASHNPGKFVLQVEA